MAIGIVKNFNKDKGLHENEWIVFVPEVVKITE